MTIRSRAPLAIAASIAFVLACPAGAQVTEFTSFTEWQAAAGLYTTIGFTEYPDSTFITTQYSIQGVLFTDGNDNIDCCSFVTFPQDGSGLDGNAAIHLSFSSPQSSIGAHYPGVIQFQLLSADQAIYTSPKTSEDSTARWRA